MTIDGHGGLARIHVQAALNEQKSGLSTKFRGWRFRCFWSVTLPKPLLRRRRGKTTNRRTI